MSARTLATKGLRGILIAVVINVILYYIFSATGIISKTVLVPGQNQPITVVPVIFATVLQLTIATLLYALLVRFTKRPNRIFRILVIVLLILSFAQPFLITDIPIAMAIGLNVLHVVAALSILWSLTQPAKNPSSAI